LALIARSLGGTRHRRPITHAAFDAIGATMPVGSVGYGAHREGGGDIWLEERWVRKLSAR
jgi:hypothetical protein